MDSFTTTDILSPTFRHHGDHMARARRAPRAPRNGNRQPNQGRGRRPQRTNRSKSSNILAQGVGAAAPKGFGSFGRAHALAAWDAFSPRHLPLPRATGPYCVVRTTRLFKTNRQYMQFGAYLNAYGDKVKWSNICAVCCNQDETWAATDTAVAVTMPMPGLGGAVTAVPSAVSVQIMNPNALQTTEGIVAAGTFKSQVNFADIAAGDATKTAGDTSNEFISFQAPRLLSAGKLALKGVQINAYPLNMAEIANFYSVEAPFADGTFFYSPRTDALRPVGFSPICVVNSDQIDLQLLVTMEWRVRFDPSNPAAAAHRYHGHCSDAEYGAHLMARADMGHGCYDIADATARSGTPGLMDGLNANMGPKRRGRR